jgi:hypothetical protein
MGGPIMETAVFSEIVKALHGYVVHPRILFTAESLPRMRALAESDPDSAAALAVWAVVRL